MVGGTSIQVEWGQKGPTTAFPAVENRGGQVLGWWVGGALGVLGKAEEHDVGQGRGWRRRAQQLGHAGIVGHIVSIGASSIHAIFVISSGVLLEALHIRNRGCQDGEQELAVMGAIVGEYGHCWMHQGAWVGRGRSMFGREKGASGKLGSGAIWVLLGASGLSSRYRSLPQRAHPSSSSLAIDALIFMVPSCSQPSGLLPSPSVPSFLLDLSP
ncbi:hypothetical protein EDD18DRAFT_1116121 [Armillaria luteobubalina]|uniref:Uncharacterized protein n=1 Tax=Armillaria luteobubalina TaxID=153913 RepID=A0AA39P0I5_9AGAR|nr:hypothetical protein EDD18DRAFT_1116121 [Armillaria luteobubalina]